ncbi:cap-specific mRNA (nucleoside-2'-O-)-methyltransferase 1-like [Amphiura filiformis]|uniref:cap-specific mRNA (nucleoside-2'-O-)-methyltransferase 1-like n=1 Tax=Amphiura filiformis TaxID=82378 RepID=UPI003B2135A6
MDNTHRKRQLEEESTENPKKLKIGVQNFAPAQKFSFSSASSSSDIDDGISSKGSNEEFSLSPNWYSPTGDAPSERIPSMSFSPPFESPSSGLGFSASSTDTPADKPLESTAASTSSSKYSAFSHKMMAMMGYKEGEGLGKDGSGRVDPVEASRQRGRRGLGLIQEGFEAADDLTWDEKGEQVSAQETKDWIPSCEQPVPQEDELREWRQWKKEKRKDVIEDACLFCDQELLTTLLQHKTVFDKLDGEEMRQARTRSNPYETIRGAIFLNRAAMKMANMDCVFDYMFTKPADKTGKPVLGAHDLLYFADICAGPGGFSEYVLWRKKCHAKGFGFTLKGPCDFKLEDFYAASPEFFEPYYGVGGIDGDGDVMRSDNQTKFREFVKENTNNKGVHFVMADGGFSVAGRENIQEILTKQLLLCQFLSAISVIRTGGHFVCKTFDLFTPFSIGLIYLLYRAFDQVSIFKCVTSRPANSERYVVCKGLRPGADAIHDFMFDLNIQLNQLKDAGDTHDILHAVPLDVIMADHEFTQYMTEQNERQARTQSQALAKIQAYVRNPNLFEPKQADVREECLKLWGIPDTSRRQPKIPDPVTKFNELSKEEGTTQNKDYFHFKPTPLERDNLSDKIHSVYDYRCMIAAGTRNFILGLGRSHVYQWDGKPSSRWKKLDGCNLHLPGDTLFEAELLQELKGEGYGQRRMQALHIIDAMWLGGTDIRNLHFTERLNKINVFVKALHRPSITSLTPLRVKDVFRCEEMQHIFSRIEPRLTKGGGGRLRLCFKTMDERMDERWFIPSGLYFIKTVKDPWAMHVSRSQQRKYFYNCMTRESVFEFPMGCAASFKDCRSNRLYWSWEDGVKIHDTQTEYDQEKLTKDEMMHHIKKHL